MAFPSKMQDRNAIAVPGSTSSIRFVVQGFVIFFLISFLGALLRQQGVDNFGQSAAQVAPVDGVVLSMNPVRFLHTKQVLAQLGIPVVQKVPPAFRSQEVEQSLESFFGSREFHSETNLKVWSNRMAFVASMEAFLAESNTRAMSKRWRFFFEDDLAVNPNITSEHGKVLLAKGLDIAEEDGFVYLGMCGPSCDSGPQVLDQHVETARCGGTCAHAFGFQPRAAAKFLKEMSEFQLDPPSMRLYFDRYLLEHGQRVKRVWVIGSNLRSPVADDHIGLLYQDRLLFPTSIG